MTEIFKQAGSLIDSISECESDIETHKNKVAEQQRLALIKDDSTDPLTLAKQMADCERDSQLSSNAVKVLEQRLEALISKSVDVHSELQRYHNSVTRQIEADNEAAKNKYLQSKHVTNAVSILKNAMELTGYDDADDFVLQFYDFAEMTPDESKAPVMQKAPSRYECDTTRQIQAYATGYQYAEHRDKTKPVVKRLPPVETARRKPGSESLEVSYIH